MKKNISLGVIIIFIGLIWLLSNLDVFSFSIIDTFVRASGKLWPLLLIGFGLNILLKENAALRLIIWILILAGILAYGIWGLNNTTNDYRYPGNYSQAHDYSLSKETGTEKGRFDLTFGAGEIRLAAAGDLLMQAKSNIPDLKYDYRYIKDSKTAVIEFPNRNRNFNFDDTKIKNLFFDVKLNTDIAWDMDLDLGAASGNLDFKDLTVSKLELDVGAADLDLYFGSKSRLSTVRITSGASNIEVYYPKDAGLKINLEGALTANNISDLGLVNQGGSYISQDYDLKAQQLEFRIQMGVGNLKFYPS